MAIIRAALVDNATSIVGNIIMIDDTEINYVEGFTIVPIPKIEIPLTEEEEELYSILTSVDPDFVVPRKYVDKKVDAGYTKWTAESGFFDE